MAVRLLISIENYLPNNFKVIIIDDNPNIHSDFIKILTFSTTLNLPTFEIDTATQSMQGIAKIKLAFAEGRPFSLAFIDIRMPLGVDGIKTIKKIWDIDPNIQIVICTTYTDYTWEETINELGVDDNLLILQKPIDITVVRQLACALTKKWALEKKLLESTNSLQTYMTQHATQQAYLQQKLEHQATHDKLTNLPNRLLLTDSLNHAIALAKRHKTICAIIFFNLDRFKLINDSLSHQAGDELLNKIVTEISKIARASDIFARLDGDTFVLISQDIPNDKLILKIISRIMQSINQPFTIENHLINITASIGISVYPKDGSTTEELLRNANLAMYMAKREGRNKFQFYEKELNAENIQLFEKEIELRRAITNHEFVLHYQPQTDTDTNKLIGIEALIRWQHPSGGLIAPNDFIPIAEDCGLMPQIGNWVLYTACAQNKKWQKLGDSNLIISVNVTKSQLNDPKFISIVRSALNNSGLAPKYLQIELTEDIVINNKKIEGVIHALTKLGVKVSFDDFGTGNSSLNYLRRISIDQLKIDKSFVQNINTHNNDDIIIRAILSMAADLKLDVIAEGVETTAQLDFLNTHHCHKIQGYYFSEPLSASAFEKYLTDHLTDHIAQKNIPH